MSPKSFIKKVAAVSSLGAIAAGSLLAGEESAATVPAEKGKVLVVYYSWSGNTEALAKKIQRATNAAIFKIEPETPYPQDYSKCTEQAKKELAQKFRPKIKAFPENVETYDTVFVGSPNWWGTYAPPVATLLDDPAFARKTIVPFFTNGGGGLQNCESDMKKQLPQAKFLKAITLPGSKAKSGGDREVAAWLKEIGIAK